MENVTDAIQTQFGGDHPTVRVDIVILEIILFHLNFCVIHVSQERTSQIKETTKHVINVLLAHIVDMVRLLALHVLLVVIHQLRERQVVLIVQLESINLILDKLRV